MTITGTLLLFGGPMRALVRTVVLALLAPGVAGPVAAQSTVEPLVAVALGGSHPPAALQDPCGGPAWHSLLEGRAGVRSGGLTLAVHGSAHAILARVVCVTAPLTRPDGVHTDPVYPFARGELLTSDARLGYRPRFARPLSLSAGAGWVWTHELPYLLASATLRNPSRLPLFLELERSWFRVPSELVTLEWKDRSPVREVGRVRRVDWKGGWSVRVGLAVDRW